MQLTEAAILDRKFGEAEGSAVSLDSKPMLKHVKGLAGQGIRPGSERRVPPISLVFREMWDTTALNGNFQTGNQCPDF